MENILLVFLNEDFVELDMLFLEYLSLLRDENVFGLLL